MATLVNDRNQLLKEAPTRILGAGVIITSGVANAFTIPANGTTALPGEIVLTAIPSRYVAPQYIWSRKFSNDASFTVLSGQTSPTLNVLGDAAFVTAASGSGIVQYKVNVIETTGLGSNPSEFTITLPILRQGVNSVVGVLTNESQTVAADSEGVVPVDTVIRSTLVIYNGISDDSANWTASITAATSGITATLINGKTINVALPLNTDNGTVEITASRQGYPNIVKVFSVSKARAGYIGEDGENGASTALVYAYQRSATALTTNPGNVVYSFDSKSIVPDWDVSQAIYSGKNFSVGAQEVSPEGLFFKPDGLKMYIVGSSSDRVHEYNLSEAWNINTAVHLQSFSVAARESGPTGVFFKPDGLKMYIIGTSSDNIVEYSLSEAWNVTTAVYLQSFYVNPQELQPRCLYFKPDGLKVYIVGSISDRVHEYNLSEAWNISTITYVQLFSVTAQDGTPEGLLFNPDGSKMYTVGSANDRVEQYTLSTPWNISTALYVKTLSISAQDTNPKGIFLSSDGANMYLIGGTNDRVYHYSLEIHNNWSKTIPAGIAPLYATVATASSTTSTDNIAAAEWSAPVLLVQNGSNGTDGLNAATVYLYARNNSTTTAPTLATTGTATYTFATATLSDTIPSGWTTTIPAEANGTTIWVVQATASSSIATGSIDNTDWSTPRVLAQKGDIGASTTAYELVVSAPVIVKTASNLYSPASITVSAVSTTGTSNPTAYLGRFRILEDGTQRYVSLENQSSYTFTPTTTSVGIIKVELYLAGGTATLLDSQEVPITVAGSSGITISVANQSHVLPSDAAGAVATYIGSGTTIQVFEGSTALVYRTTLSTTVSSFTIGTPTLSVANAITVGAISGNVTTTATVAQHSAMQNATNVVVITYPITYNRANGAQAAEFVTQSLAKTLAGSIGVRGSRSLYSTDVAYTSTYDFDGAGATLPGGPSYAARATQLIAAAVAGSTPTTPINGDTVTFSNGSTYVYTITHNGTSWSPPGTIIDGSLLVTESVTASKINSNGLEVRSPTGELILGSGGLQSYNLIGGSKPPIDATNGADSSNLKAGTGTNLVFNGDLTDGLAGVAHIYNSGGSAVVLGWNLPNYRVAGEGTGYIHKAGTGTQVVNTTFDARFQNGADKIAVRPGARYEVSAWFNTHRCNAAVNVHWYNSAGTYLGENQAPFVEYLESQVASIADMRQSHFFINAPATAVQAEIRLRAVGLNDSPYLFFSRVFFAEATAAQTEKSPWSTGRGISQITGANASTYIANAAIGSAQIGSISLVGTSNFSVKSGTVGARMEMDSRAIKIFGPGPGGTTILRVQIGDLTI
jgi:sugar lactone lactonase YvrE